MANEKDFKIKNGLILNNDNSGARLTREGNYFRNTTQYGYIQLGPNNTGFAHIDTDRTNFYFSKKIQIDSGEVSSYNEDLFLQRAGSTKLTLGTSTATFADNVVVTGDLTVNGTTITLNTATLDVEDKNITLNYSTGDSSASADGAGITIQDAVDASTDATFNWNATNDRWEISHNLNFQDGDNITWGGNSIVQHTGSKTHIGDNTTGSLLTLTGGNVGIGTLSPSKKLHVENGSSGFTGSYNSRTAAIFEGSASNGTAISIMSPSSGYSGIFFGDATQEYSGQIQYDHPTNAMKFLVNAGEKMRIDSSGNVGIGTTSPLSNTNYGNLTLSGTTGGSLFFADDGVQKGMLLGNNDEVRLTASVGYLRFDTGGNNERMRIDSSGNVGIGTTSPSSKLDVVGTVDATNYTLDYAGGSIRPKLTRSSASGGLQIATDGTVGNTNSLLEILNSSTSRVSVLGNGNVGIGTDSPSTTLELSNAFNAPTLRISNESNTVAAGSDLGIIEFYSGDNSNSGDSVQASLSVIQPTEANVSGEFVFKTSNAVENSGALTERVRIAKDGKVGIGTDSPADLLHLSANSPVLRLTNTNDNGKSSVEFWDNQSGTSQAGEVFYDDTSNVFGLQGNANGIVFRASNTFPSSELMRITSSGNVGIGTSSPGEKLSVAPDTDNSAEIGRAHIGSVGHSDYAGFSHVDKNTTGNYALMQHGSGVTYLNASSGTQINFRINNTQVMEMTSTGLGIGTTNPTARLQVDSSGLGGTAGDATTQAVFRTTTGNASFLEIKDVRTLAGTDWTTAGKRIQMKIDSTYMGYVQFNGNGNNSGMSIGTGTTTTAPGNVSERLRIDSSGRLLIGKAAVDNTTVGFRFDSASGFASFVRDGGEPLYLNRKTSDGDILKIAKDGTVVGVIGTQNWGIGTSSPSAKLEINGTTKLGTSSYSASVDTITDGSLVIPQASRLVSESTSGQYLRTIFTHESSNGHYIFGQQGTSLIGDMIFYPGSSGNIRFYGSGSEDVRIDNQGRLGIGTTSPVSLLDLGTGNTSGSGLSFGNTLSEIRRGNSGSDIQISHWGNVAVIIDSDNNDTSTRAFKVMEGNSDASTANELFRVRSDGRVGIGTTTLHELFNLSGIDGSRISFEDQGTRRYTLGNEGTAFSIYDASASSERMRIDSSGNVGIGTNSPAFTNGGGLEIERATSATLRIQRAGADAAELFMDSTGFNIRDLSVGKILFGTSNTERMRLTDTGLGIGTTSPAHLLDVNGSGRINGLTFGANSATRSINTHSDAGKLQLSGGTGTSNTAYIEIEGDDFGGTDLGGDISFVSNGAARMLINRSGNVGIGTNSPADKLHVNGRVRTNTSGIALSDTNAVIYRSSNDLEIRTYAGYDINLIPSGNVGIGTTSPSANLAIVDGGSLTNTDANNRLMIDAAGHSYILLNSPEGYDQGIHFRNNTDGSFVGRIAYAHRSAGDSLSFRVAGSDRFVINSSGAITFNNAYTFPTADGSANQVLQTDGSGNLSFATVTSGGGAVDSIANFADNRVITASDADSLNGESQLTFNGTTLAIRDAVYITNYTSADTDITGLVTGSTFGGLIQGDDSGHLVIGLRENGSSDSFAIVSGGGDYTTDTTYDTLAFQVNALGNTTVGGQLTTGGNVGINTSDPDGQGYSFAEDLVILGGASASDGVGITLRGNGKRYGVIAFGDNADDNAGEIWYDHNANSMNFRTAGTLRATIDTSGNFNLNTGDLKIGNTSVITSSRNLTNIGTISSGAITSSGVIESAMTGNAKLIADGTTHANVEIDRGSTSSHNNLIYRTAGDVKWRIWQDGADNILKVRNEVAGTNVLTFTDTNSSFAGTISSGAITSSSTIKAQAHSAWNVDSGLTPYFEDDAIQLTKTGSNYLVAEYGNKTYSDAIIEAEFRTTNSTHFGIFFFGQATDPHNNSYNVILRSTDTVRLQTRISATQEYPTGFGGSTGTATGINLDDGNWHSVKATISGTRLVIEVDGTSILDGTMPTTYTSGTVGLILYDNTAYFRNFQVRETTAAYVIHNDFPLATYYGSGDVYLDLHNSTGNASGTLLTADNGNTWLNADGGKDLWLNWYSKNNPGSYADLQVGNGNGGNSILFVDGSANRVGILDTSPSYSLDVNGTARFTGEVKADDHIRIVDSKAIYFGTGNDFNIYHNGSHSYMDHIGTGNLYIRNTSNDSDISFQSDDGSGGFTEYFRLDGGTEDVVFTKPIRAVDVNLTGSIQNTAVPAEASVKINENGYNDGTTYFRDLDIYDGKGTQFVKFDGSTQRVGIGTTVPATKVQIGSGNTDEALRVKHSDNTYVDVHGYGLFMSRTSSYIRPTADGSQDLYLGDTGSYTWQKVIINTTSGVGIGTDSPSQALHIADSSGNSILEIQRTNTNTTGTVGAIQFNANDDHAVSAIVAIGDGDDEGSHLAFNTTSAASANSYFTSTTERMRIDSSGNVGIGTTSPSELLHVYGNMRVGTTSQGRIKFVDSDDTEILGQDQTHGSGACMTFKVNNANRMHIDNSGRVGIGTTTPGQPLDVAGIIRSSATNPQVRIHTSSGSNSGYLVFGNSSDDDVGYIEYNHGDNSMRFITNASEDMRLTSGGTLHVDGDVIAFSSTISDERLKDDVVTIESALDKVMSLRGVEYIWNKTSKEGKKDLGVIAQEVEQVLPEIVKEKEMPLLDGETYKTVDYEKLTAVLIEAIKEQQKEIEQLKKHSHPAKDMCDMKGYEELVARIEKMEKNYGNN